MKRRVLAGILTLLLLLTLTACGGGAKTEEAAKSEPMAEAPAAGEMNYGSDMMYDAVMEESKSEAGGASVPQEQKLIITARMELETTDFEPAVQGLNDLVAEFGGYFENSSIANRKSGSRWADYTVRVPATRYELFMNQVGELCHETWREASAQNITEAYYDTAARLETAEIKLDRLQELLKKADNMADIITIESAISETEYTIESLILYEGDMIPVPETPEYNYYRFLGFFTESFANEVCKFKTVKNHGFVCTVADIPLIIGRKCGCGVICVFVLDAASCKH